MSLGDDERGQAIQVGAVLLFAILIIAFSTYQAVIIPADNRRVEFNHNQEVQDQLADLRNAVLGTAESTRSQSVTIGLGTQYPSRTLGLNPPPASGSLRTVGTGDPLVNLTIENAVAADEETADLWDGTPRNYSTGAISYAPTYNRYQEAPTTTYEHSVLYNSFSSANALVLANQSMIDGDRISLVALNGSLDRASSRSTTVDVRPVSSSTETILIDERSSSEPVTLSFTSLRDADAWNRTFGNEANVTVSQSPSPAGGDYHRIHVTLDGDSPYRLAMTKAAVGTGATAEDPAYLTTVDGDGANVVEGNSHAVTLAVRDAYNNPVGGVPVASSIDGTATTDGDGKVTFTYDTTGVGPGDKQLDFTVQNPGVLSGGTFNGSTPENVTADVRVTEPANGSGSGAYAVDWTDPSDEAANSGAAFGSCDNESCVWDVGASANDHIELNATLDPVFEGIDLEYAVNNSTVGSLSAETGETGSNGAAATELTAAENGAVDVLASGNDGSDTIAIEVVNASGGGPTGQILQPVELRDSTSNRLVFRIENTGSETVTVEEFSVDVTAAQTDPNTVLDNGNGAEVEILRTSGQNGESNRNGNPTNFAVNGTYYDFVADSNHGSTGAYAIIEPGDDTVDVDLRQFQPGINELQLVDSAAAADAVVTLRLSDGSVQEFYFEEA